VRVLIQIWSESAERASQFVEVGGALLEIRDMRLIPNRSVFYFRFRVVISETLFLNDKIQFQWAWRGAMDVSVRAR
jgi:hypothetical protein